MKVKMTTALAGKDFVFSFGEVVTVDEKFGKSLINGGLAMLVEDVTEVTEVIEEAPKKPRGRKRKLGAE